MRRPLSLKSDTHTESMCVDVAGISVKVIVYYPGRSLNLPKWLLASRDDEMSSEKSAEVIVGCSTATEGLNSKLRSRDLNHGYGSRHRKES